MSLFGTVWRPINMEDIREDISFEGFAVCGVSVLKGACVSPRMHKLYNI